MVLISNSKGWTIHYSRQSESSGSLYRTRLIEIYSCGWKGNIHIVGYTFSGEFTGSLCTLIEPNQPSLVTIEAVCDTKICYIPYLKVEEFFATNVETMQVKCTLIEQSYLLMYHRLIDMYCKTTAELYLDLLNRCPDIQEYITLKEIASFLQVTPETISRIRRGLNK